MGRRLQLDWSETAEELRQQYRAEKHAQRRERLLTFWHLCEGKQVKDVSQMIGTDVRVIQTWLSWYRQGGLAEVLKRVTGHGTVGAAPLLNQQQQKALVARVKLGDFATVWEVMAWVKDRWGIVYSYEGMRSVMKRNDLRLKVPRPRSEKADPQAQAVWQKKA